MLDVSISGYRAWKRGGAPGRKRLTDVQALAIICAIHVELKGAYGSPRMVRELRLRGFTAGKERVERLMRENGIRTRHKRRYKVTTDSKHGLPVATNLLDRNFTPAAPNQVWTSDITYLGTDEGMSNKEIHRCPKRYIVRELYPIILADLAVAANIS